MKLTFFNHYGVGDLFESREFVLDLMRLFGVTTCDYACRYPGIFADLPQINCIELTERMQMRTAWQRDGDEMLVNTWIGCRNAKTQPPGDYVLWPGVGCCVENIYRMYNDYLAEMGKMPLPRSIVEYLPTIDYARVGLGMCEPFLEGIVKTGVRTQLILICNGKTGSGHAYNFDFGLMLNSIQPKLGLLFLFTERSGSAMELAETRPDIIFTDNITARSRNGFDLLAISYLSRFCSVIVGRCSGAQMPCETLENWMNPDKTILSFTHHDNGATFVRHPEVLGLKMRRVWSGAETPEAAAEVLKGVL